MVILSMNHKDTQIDRYESNRSNLANLAYRSNSYKKFKIEHSDDRLESKLNIDFCNNGCFSMISCIFMR